MSSHEYVFTLFPVHPQSLQMAAFLFTVCHVVIVVQDWFTDINMYRYFVACTLLSFFSVLYRPEHVKQSVAYNLVS